MKCFSVMVRSALTAFVLTWKLVALELTLCRKNVLALTYAFKWKVHIKPQTACIVSQNEKIYKTVL